MRGLPHVALALSAALVVPHLALAQSSSRTPPKAPRSPSATDQLTDLGRDLLAEGAVTEAQKHCQKAVDLDPTHRAAGRCLVAVAGRQAAEAETKKKAEAAMGAATLNAMLAEAEARKRGAEEKAVAAMATARGAAKTPEDLNRITAELRKLHPSAIAQAVARGRQWVEPFGTVWIFDIIFALLFLLGVYSALRLARVVRRTHRALKTGGGLLKTRWLYAPIEDKHGLGIDSLVLDAVERMKHDLAGPVEIPTLVPLRPTKGEPYQPEVWKDFRIHPPRKIRGIHHNLSIAFAQNRLDLAEAIGQLQLKVGGVELGSIAKLVRSLRQWLNEGVPTISGSASVAELPDGRKEVTVRLSRCAHRIPFAAVTASTEHQSATEAARLAAERAAYKLAYIFAMPACSHAQADGLAARRQGIALLQRYVACGEDAGEPRRLGLEKAVFNLRFARAALGSDPIGPAHSAEAVASAHDDNLVECELLLFEGIGEALLGHAREAVELFRTVRDIVDADRPAQLIFRLQALYNHAVLEGRGALSDPPMIPTRSAIARAMQLHEQVIADADAALSQLAADHARAEVDVTTGAEDPEAQKQLAAAEKGASITLQAVRTMGLLSRLGYVSAAAQWSSAEWDAVELRDVQHWLKIAESLIAELDAAQGTTPARPELSVMDIIKVETHRAFATIAARYLGKFRMVPLPSIVGPRQAPVQANDPAASVPLDSPDTASADRGLIARMLASLAFLTSRQNPDVRLCKLLVAAHLQAHDTPTARRYALRAINMGGRDECFYFAAALDALASGNGPEARRISQGFTTDKKIPEFRAIHELYPAAPIGVYERSSAFDVGEFA
jgi:hypothetical protein